MSSVPFVDFITDNRGRRDQHSAYFLYSGSKIKNLNIPNSVTSIGYYAFRDCSELVELNFNATDCSTCGSSNSPAFPSSISSLTIGDGVTSIPAYFFYNGSKIQNLNIPNSVTTIGNYAFYDCPNLKSLTLGSGLLSIGKGAFSYRPGSSYYNMGIAKVFWLGNTPPTNSRTISASVNYVANDQYNLTNQLKYPFLSSKFTVDGTIYVPVSPAERTCDVVDCIYDDDFTTVTISDKVINRGIEMTVNNVNPYSFYDNEKIQSVTLSNNGIVESNAFEGCDKLTDLSASNKGHIGESAFYGCSALNNVELKENITGIFAQAFKNCSLIPELVIPNTVTTLGESAFQGCSSMKSVSIGTGVPSLPTRVFYGCSSLESLSIPNNVASIGDYAFWGCSSLGDITLQDSSETLTLGSNGSNPLFADCPLDEVYIGRKLSYETSSDYGNSPFYRNTSLRTVEITDAETEVYDNEFYGCSGLNSLKIGNGVKAIGKWAFSGCSSLDYFSAGYNVESIGAEAFSDCTGLTKYYSYSVVPPTCGNQALDDINKWECTLYVPSESSDEYKAAAQWKDFFFVDEMSAVLVATIELSATEVEMNVDGSLQLVAEVMPANATNQGLVWSSSDVSVVDVSAEGLVTALKAGTATITVKSADGNAEATCVITVTEMVGLENVHSDNSYSLLRTGNGYIVKNGLGECVEVYSTDGKAVYLAPSYSEEEISLEPGLYIIRADNRVWKVRF